METGRNIFTLQDGGIATILAFIAPVIIGFIGLGVEVPTWYSQKGDLQSATDAAAIAAAYQIGSGTSLSTTASNEMSRNGYGTGITMTLNNPPASGSYTGNNEAVEVIVTKSEAGLFSKVLGMANVSMKTRAVALFTPASGSGCILGLSTAATDIITSGNVNLNMGGCVLASNDMGNSSVTMSGNVTLTLQYIYTAGGINKSGNATENNSSPNITNATAVPDPFSSLPMPSVGSCNNTGFSVSGGSSSVTMSPGVYCGNINISSQANVTMSPGTYIVNGGNFNISGGSSISGSGVTIIFTNNASFSESGNSSMSVSAPTTGTYAGILMYADRTQSQQSFSFSGDTSTNLTGVIYTPTGNITFSGGNSGAGSCTRLVAYTVTFTGGSNLTPNCPPGYPGIPIPGAGSSGVVLKE